MNINKKILFFRITPSYYTKTLYVLTTYNMYYILKPYKNGKGEGK